MNISFKYTLRPRDWAYIFCLFLFGILLFFPKKHIVIATEHTSCYISEQEFMLQWRHSVEKKIWQEYYKMKGQKLLLYKTYLQTFGAGVPATGQVIDAPKGFIGLAMDAEFNELNWVVSRNIQAMIGLTSNNLQIAQYVDDYTVIHIHILKYPQLIWFFKEQCSEQYQQSTD